MVEQWRDGGKSGGGGGEEAGAFSADSDFVGEADGASGFAPVLPPRRETGKLTCCPSTSIIVERIIQKEEGGRGEGREGGREGEGEGGGEEVVSLYLVEQMSPAVGREVA